MAFVGGASDELIERVENAKGIPDLPISLRRVAVPGTGNVVNAELFAVVKRPL
jgi:hypothetical protein